MAGRDARRSRVSALVRVALACGLAAVAVAGCTGPPAGSAGSASALPVATPTHASVGEQLPTPDEHPTLGLPVVAPGSGFVTSTADTPGIVCLNFTWASPRGGPALSDGLAFVAREVRVEPPSWALSPSGCAGDRAPCLGSPLSDAYPECQVALVRRDGAKATGDTGSLASLAGTVTCTVPATDQQCAQTRDGLAQQDGTTVPLDDAVVAASPPHAPTPPAPVPTSTSAPTPAQPLQSHVPGPIVTVRPAPGNG